MDLPSTVQAGLDPRTPERERVDINQELFARFTRGATLYPELIDPEWSAGIRAGKSLFEQQFAGLDVSRRTVPVRDARNDRISVLHVSELGVLSPWPGTRWTEKPDAMGFQALSYMVESVPTLNLIILTRQRQVQTAARRYKDRSEYPYGYQIRRADGQPLSQDDKAEIERLDQFITNCSDAKDAVERHWKRRADNMHTFLGKMVRATLTADACPVEAVPTRRGDRISAFYAIPYETVRLCSEEGYEGDDSIVGLQLYDSRVCTLYTPDRLIYDIRNPRPHVMVGGYGYAEAEMLVRFMTFFLNTMTYNAAGFDRNQIPRGILQLYGNFKQEELDFFKLQWNTLMTGPAQRWRLPVLASSNREAGATYTSIDTQFTEMHFAKWISLLNSFIFGMYGMAPEEANLDSFTSKSGGLNTGNDTAERLASSKDKGLEPILQFFERFFNEWIIPRSGIGRPGKYVLTFRGLHPITPELQWEKLTAVQTRDEARADMDMDPCVDPTMGEMLLDPAAAAAQTQAAMFDKQAEMMGGMDDQQGQLGPDGQPQQRVPDAIRSRFGGGDSAQMNPTSRGGDPGTPQRDVNRGRDKLRKGKEAAKGRETFQVMFVDDRVAP